MERLLPEIVSYIFQFLSVSDRKEASLVCKKWYYASLDPRVQKDVVFKCSLQDHNKMALNASGRKLTHISLGDKHSSSVSEENLVKLLSQCVCLKHLDLSFGNSLFLSGRLLEDPEVRASLMENLHTVKELKLSCLRHMTDVTFTRLVSVLQNVENISLASHNILFHNNGNVQSERTLMDSSAVFNFTSFLRFVTCRAQKIKHVDLSFTGVNDQALEQFCQVPGLCLESLVLKACIELTDRGIIAAAQNQSCLHYLDISYCKGLATGKSFCSSLITNLPKLHTLKARSCPRIGQCDIQFLANSASLQSIDFGEALNMYENDLIAGLCSRQQSLAVVQLAYCPDVTDHFVKCLCESNPGLRHLDLTSCRKITDNSLFSITRNALSLQCLYLAYCHQITDLGLLGYISEIGHSHHHSFEHDHDTCNCMRQRESRIFSPPKGILKEHQSSINKAQTQLESGDKLFKLSNLLFLKSLDLSSCLKISDLGVMEAIKFKELQSLSLEHVPKLTDKAVGHLARCNPSLEVVSLTGCEEVTDQSVKSLCTHCPRLKSLSVSQNDKLTDASIATVTRCQRLRSLDISFCGNISYDAVMALETNCPRLKFQFRPHMIY